MKEIIKGMGMILFSGAVVAGGTGAFFDDFEKSEVNFAAETVDLRMDSLVYANDLVCFDAK